MAAVGQPGAPLPTTGVAACTADLYRGQARCTGLVPGERYRLVRRRGNRSALSARGRRTGSRASAAGSARCAAASGSTLRGAGGRVLTVLHVAHLRVDLRAGAQTGLRRPLRARRSTSARRLPVRRSRRSPPCSASAPPAGRLPARRARAPAGPAGCRRPAGGDRPGSPAASPGPTVPDDPRHRADQDATLYGPFRAIAQAGGSGRRPATVSLRIIARRLAPRRCSPPAMSTGRPGDPGRRRCDPAPTPRSGSCTTATATPARCAPCSSKPDRPDAQTTSGCVSALTNSSSWSVRQHSNAVQYCS